VSHEAISIIGGSGALGFGLAVRLGQAGVPIVIGSRDAGRAQEAAAQAAELVPSGTFSGQDNAGAAAATEIVLLSVPFRSQSETLTNLKTTLREGQLVVDATVPLAAAVSGKATRTLGVDFAAEPVGDEVGVGGDVDAEGLDVVAGVGDHGQLGADLLLQAGAELGAAGAAGEDDDPHAQGSPSGRYESLRPAWAL
jgi:NADPH-dependent F420 reductase